MSTWFLDLGGALVTFYIIIKCLTKSHFTVYLGCWFDSAVVVGEGQSNRKVKPQVTLCPPSQSREIYVLASSWLSPPSLSCNLGPSPQVVLPTFRVSLPSSRKHLDTPFCGNSLKDTLAGVSPRWFELQWSWQSGSIFMGDHSFP